MNAQTTFNFQWLSPLGIAVVLFLLSGAINILTPIASLFLLHRYGPISPQTPQYFAFSARADEAWLGKSPAQLVEEFPGLRRLYLLLIDFTEAFALGFAILTIGLVWFGLRTGQGWALWTILGGNVAMLAIYWGVALIPIMRQYGFPYMEIFHPFAAIPTVLVPIATVLAWIGLRTGG